VNICDIVTAVYYKCQQTSTTTTKPFSPKQVGVG
jgi:hypothetical protein